MVIGTDARARGVIILLWGHRKIVKVAASAESGSGFAIDDREVRPTLARGGIPPGVIPTGDIQGRGELGLGGLWHALRQADRAGRVERLHTSRHGLQQTGSFGVFEPFEIPDFIADAPDHDARMIAIPANEVGILLFAVFWNRDAF